MPEPEPRHLRVIDGNGELDEDARVLPADYATMEELNRRLRREIAGLKGQLTRLHRVDPQAATVERVLTYWRDRCYGPTSRVEVALEGKRGDVVRRTLRRLVESDDDPELASPKVVVRGEAAQRAEARAVERIMAAIDGCAAFPFEGQYGQRFAEAGPRLKRKADIVYILRDEVKMEQFADLVERDERRRAYAADLWRMVQDQPHLKLILASFGPEPHGELLARLVRWACANP